MKSRGWPDAVADVARGWWLASTAIVVVLFGACDRPESLNRELFADDAQWARSAEAWVRAVPLGRDRRLVRASDSEAELRAWVLPGEAAGALTVTSDDRDVELEIASPTVLRLPVAAGSRVELSANVELQLVRPRLVAGRPPARRVVLIVADTLRADHVNAELMPEVVKRFAGGARSELAFSAAAWTLPSVAALFTGTEPTHLRGRDDSLIALPDVVTTLAERFRARGAATVAVVANPTVNHENGYSQGFDAFFVPKAVERGELHDAAWVVERALAAAEAFAGEDLFLYLHFMDPHDPYRNHELGEALVPPPTGSPISTGRLEQLSLAYASEVRHLDRALGRFLDQLGDVDLLVFTSDHGEELGDHGGMKHGPSLYREVTRVPLLVEGLEVAGESGRQLALRLSHPYSLVELGSLLLEGPAVATQDRHRVTVETFVHAPPRWSLVDESGQWIVAARDLPQPQLDAIGQWLAEHHPAVAHELHRSEGSVTSRDPGPIPERALTALVDQYAGYETGIWIFARDRRLGSVEVLDAASLRCWLGCESLEVNRRGRSWRLALDARERPILLFLRARQTGSAPVLEGLAAGERPAELPKTGAVAWSETRRPDELLGGIDETLERLRALGYIGS